MSGQERRAMLLKFLRKKKNMKRIIWGLAILIIPAFVIWGAGTDKKNNKGPGHAGEIFNRKVSHEEYFNMWQVTRDYALKTFGTNVPPEFIDQMAWSRILLLEKAKQDKIIVKDTDVVEKIISYPAFQRNGSFDKKLYKSMLGDAAKGFEERLRDDILISRLREKAVKNISVNDEEVKEEYKNKFEKIKSSYISTPFSDFEKDVSYEEPELISFYEENKELFLKPEGINVRYVEVAFSRFEKEAYVTEEEIKRYFEEHLSDYKKPDSEDMPQLDEAIKISITEQLSFQRKISLAEELSYRLLDEALKKKNLDETSRSFSLEAKETGFFNMQQEIPGIGWSYEFTRKGFELKPGEISSVLIKGADGFYIIQLTEKKPPYMPEFKDTRDAVIKSYVQNKSIELSEESAKKLYAAIKDKIKNGLTLEEAAKENGKEPAQTDFLTREEYIPALGPAKDFVEGAVSLENNEIAGPIKMAQSWVILKLDEYQGVDEIKFAEEKDTFKEELLSNKKQETFDKYFQELRKGAGLVIYAMEE